MSRPMRTEFAIVSEQPLIETARPLLKWAGGKKQLLNDLLPIIPKQYNRYIEPFFGGGALFFAIQPKSSIIADSNPEIINMYRMVAANVEKVIASLMHYDNSDETFYAVRALNWMEMEPSKAAARTIFLNHTCFNGLYRVNKNGQFNVPYGKYKNPKIIDKEALYAASKLLNKATILCGDYKDILKEQAQSNDFIFLDPPYLPVSQYSDFKRYTKEQFYEEDHVELANEIDRLHELGCHVILTNSNHPLVHELYGKYGIEVLQTKRHISCNGNNRIGEDIIVNIPPAKKLNLHLVPQPQPKQVSKYPTTRYMGSKSKLIDQIWAVASQFEFNTVADLFSGSGIVGYMFKAHGKTVFSNDYMAMSATFTKAMIENNSIILPIQEALLLLEKQENTDRFVEQNFQGLYFSDEDNKLIDTLRTNIANIHEPYNRAIALSALIRACTKKRPRGIFTYIGERYDDGRKDIKLSLADHFIEAVKAINGAVFDNGKENKSRHGDAMTYKGILPDMVYIDPPYYSPYSDNEYVRRYHFVEGLARDWKGVEIQKHTLTKKFKSYPTPFSTRNGAADAFDKLFRKYSSSILIVSYSSNSLPGLDEMVSIMSKYKNYVDVVPIDYRYSFGNQGTISGKNKNRVLEYLFVGY
ncbi:MAG: Dam family site-specific DNA-(adenine-N6)-methyltransferase [Eubacteriales bacterium]|nr:Dam family site-specific DNA-(adenine-N6)-methyltransferase [Eubacteriales bacterium]MDD3199215.1 Dam family site-specific DNA-(adenine-N6)-methyltransferase [Eubacteriales bacterium]MDD4629130.1 Dam family site-specific DNA-(adenine-N6)-methyltransferase [Eubacteriales bacterium]